VTYRRLDGETYALLIGAFGTGFAVAWMLFGR